MQIFTLILAMGFVQIWGAQNPLHKDGWFIAWVERVRAVRIAHELPYMGFLLSVGTICLLVQMLFFLPGTLLQVSHWLLLPVGLVLLLYSLGRGEFGEIVAGYTEACSGDDWATAVSRCEPLGVDANDIAPNDWSSLHERVLDEAAYKGFERLFAVLFWFVLLGPVAALFYRLTVLYTSLEKDDKKAAGILWVLEWPVVRLLGLSFCFTGNFAGGYKQWQESLFCFQSSSKAVLSRMVMGALSVDEDLEQNCEVTRKELNYLHRLYARSLWFWVFSLAIVTIVAL